MAISSPYALFRAVDLGWSTLPSGPLRRQAPPRRPSSGRAPAHRRATPRRSPCRTPGRSQGPRRPQPPLQGELFPGG
jgi:hypothetical protein